MKSPFQIPVRLSANPHLYDYLHCIDLEPGGSVLMMDGAGQFINAEVHGKYRVSGEDASSIIHFSDLVEIDPYEDNETVARHDSFQVAYVKEEGLFAFKREVAWQIEDETQWPCLLYTSRLVFDADPLQFLDETQQDNLYFVSEDEASRRSDNYYYADSGMRELPLVELEHLGEPDGVILCWPDVRGS